MSKPTKKPGRPIVGSKPADHWIQLRVSGTRKGTYVKKAREEGKKLAQWIFEKCDAAAGYKE